ncbi:hypothetical protein A4D02_32895 [Niastella koreensis]|uniref:Uncharacterized protein n=2 Tax=Niastella koreensis TaxID=354356 RepID=G8T8P6_NIAKG|nr:DUF6266 family protein [Niastella koreensis]AEW01226.1 hypothetical protein Niako_4986 [Niastella koreensis GR20-10]OQP45991.1 hypothetical protein A4D02_32895 [Niastella koreensis]
MGKMNNGILDNFSGTIGKVVGSNWRGVPYMRSKAKKRTGALSDAQLEQQARFAIAGKFTQSMNDLLTLGFKDQAVKMTGKNYAQSIILRDAITGTYPDFQIDYSKVPISQGKLTKAKSPVATAEANSILKFTWTNDAGRKLAKANDQAVLIAYCPEMNETEYAFGPARDAATGNLDVAEFSGKKVHAWISFMSANGKLIANSVYCGELTIS